MNYQTESTGFINDCDCGQTGGCYKCNPTIYGERITSRSKKIKIIIIEEEDD